MCPLCGNDHPDAECCPNQVTGSHVGQLVADKYRIIAPLAEGGMGAVYEARHEGLDRPFAIKFIHAWLAEDEEWLERFRREATAAGRLVNDHIASVLDFGTLADGTPYIVMELLRGETLGSRQERTPPLSRSDSVEIVRQACVGIAAAHKVGIIHRDLKPDNLFLCKRDSGGFNVKILDFGIAKVVDTEGNTTKTGQVMGTPAYMAPEQARGESAIDKRADIYALGVILYELLSGEELFSGDSYNAVLFKVLSHEVPRIDTLREEVSRSLADSIHRALHRDIDHRFASVNEFVDAIASDSGSRSAGDSLQPEAKPEAKSVGASSHTTSRTTLTKDQAQQDTVPMKRVSLTAVLAVSVALLLLVALMMQPWTTKRSGKAVLSELSTNTSAASVLVSDNEGRAKGAGIADPLRDATLRNEEESSSLSGDLMQAEGARTQTVDPSDGAATNKALVGSRMPSREAAKPPTAEPRAAENDHAENEARAEVVDSAPIAPAGSGGQGVGASYQEATGNLSVRSPLEGTLFIDGRRSGAVPIRSLRLSVGMHNLVVRSTTGQVYRGRIMIKADQSAVVDVTFPPLEEANPYR